MITFEMLIRWNDTLLISPFTAIFFWTRFYFQYHITVQVREEYLFDHPRNKCHRIIINIMTIIVMRDCVMCSLFLFIFILTIWKGERPFFTPTFNNFLLLKSVCIVFLARHFPVQGHLLWTNCIHPTNRRHVKDSTHLCVTHTLCVHSYFHTLVLMLRWRTAMDWQATRLLFKRRRLAWMSSFIFFLFAHYDQVWRF